MSTWTNPLHGQYTFPGSPTDQNNLAKGLVEFYQESWDAGIKGLFDSIAQSNQGAATAAWDRFYSWATSPRRKSQEMFLEYYMAACRASASRLWTQASFFTPVWDIAKTALSALAGKIPIPLVGTVVSAIMNKAVLDDKAIESQLRALDEGKALLDKRQGVKPAAGRSNFQSAGEAKQAAATAFDTYVSLIGYIKTLSRPLQTWGDAITYPEQVFDMQAAASRLAVALHAVAMYTEGMRMQLLQLQHESQNYIEQLPQTMEKCVNSVLADAYARGRAAGTKQFLAAVTESQKKNVRDTVLDSTVPMTNPQDAWQAPPQGCGAARALAIYVTDAIAQGFWDSFMWDYQVKFQRVYVPPLPQRARSSAVFGRF